ncbi:MAG TPA: Crp/Fnr family transcriptional regulator [Terriglobales bacterium]|nr:Crp/Fnr family transcriptional regulator [Terriglobales bacterium]
MAVANILIKKSTLLRPEPLQPGSRTDSDGTAVKNVLLLSIPDYEFDFLRPHLQFTTLPHHYVLHEQGDKLEFAYFPNEGMVSLVVISADGRSVEVGIMGKEGMVGTPLTVGLQRGPYRAIMQIPGAGVRIRADVLQEILPTTPAFQLELTRYLLMQGLQMAQVAACNRLHELEHRLARWLLMCQDRVDSEVLPLTHEFLAQMLGTGRPSVTLAAGILERAGLIENLRGTVRIINRKNLEQAACECYAVIQHFNGGLGLK